MKILVLAGGLSLERCVSLSSGSLIAAALRRRGHRVLTLDVFRGRDIKNTDIDALFTTEQSELLCVGEELPDLSSLEAERESSALIGEGVIELCRASDVVFIALHGSMGENGQIQATLDNFGIKYTGTGYVGSLLAMDKDLSKKLFTLSGILTPPWVLCKRECADNEENIIEKIGLPCVVKPSNGGSSVGVSLVFEREELSAALERAFAFEETVVVEKMILGREISCGFLGDSALPAVEIIPQDGFYDYTNKYREGATTELCPAPLDAEKAQELSDITKAAFGALRLFGYARFDYILDAEGKFWCLEANTLPGMTPTSLLPQEAAAIGIGYDELCERIVETANKK